MSTPTKADNSGKLQLTERELEILSNAWKCMKNQPEIDYTKLAAECGMTNIRSASNAWSNIKKKLFSDIPASGAATPTSGKKRKTPAKTATPKAKKNGAQNGDDGAEDDDEDVAPDTPTVKRGRTKAKKEKKEDDDDIKQEVDDKSKVKEEEIVEIDGAI